MEHAVRRAHVCPPGRTGWLPGGASVTCGAPLALRGRDGAGEAQAGECAHGRFTMSDVPASPSRLVHAAWALALLVSDLPDMICA